MRKTLLAALLAVSVLVGALNPVQATDRDVKAVITAGSYGILFGALGGLIAWPISGSERAIFLGASLGLYLGIGAGFYHVAARDDLENPLRASPSLSLMMSSATAFSARTPLTQKAMRPWVSVALVRF
jgi:hypothetical protein